MDEAAETRVSSVEDLSDEQFLEIFKISRSVFMYLYNEIKHYFKAPRVHAVAPMTRLACCLQILSNRMLNQNIIRQNVTICPQLSVSQPVVSRSVEMVLNVFEKKLCPMWIKFPSTEMEISQCKKRFYDETGMVDVIGCVTCLNVSVLPFINNQDRFGNDNGVQSINVQLVCDYDMRILSVDPRYPGGVPDTDIWSVSTERDELERIYRNGDKHVLLAHSGYPLEPWLITPFVLDESSTQQQVNFNRRHAKANRRILKCLNILQSRFEILRSARYPAEKMTKIVNACCALYNIALENGCFNNLNNYDANGEEKIRKTINKCVDCPETNQCYSFGSQVRHEMMHMLN